MVSIVSRGSKEELLNSIKSLPEKEEDFFVLIKVNEKETRAFVPHDLSDGYPLSREEQAYIKKEIELARNELSIVPHHKVIKKAESLLGIDS